MQHSLTYTLLFHLLYSFTQPYNFQIKFGETTSIGDQLGTVAELPSQDFLFAG